MKLIASGVIFSAAIVRSPSFSRSSSSTTMTILPARIASMASSMRAKGLAPRRAPLAISMCRFMFSQRQSRELSRAHHILTDEVALKVHPISDLGTAEIRVAHRKGYHLYVDSVSSKPGNGETDAVDGDRPFLNDV